MLVPHNPFLTESTVTIRDACSRCPYTIFRCFLHLFPTVCFQTELCCGPLTSNPFLSTGLRGGHSTERRTDFQHHWYTNTMGKKQKELLWYEQRIKDEGKRAYLKIYEKREKVPRFKTELAMKSQKGFFFKAQCWRQLKQLQINWKSNLSNCTARMGKLPCMPRTTTIPVMKQSSKLIAAPQFAYHFFRTTRYMLEQNTTVLKLYCQSGYRPYCTVKFEDTTPNFIPNYCVDSSYVIRSRLSGTRLKSLPCKVLPQGPMYSCARIAKRRR